MSTWSHSLILGNLQDILKSTAFLYVLSKGLCIVNHIGHVL